MLYEPEGGRARAWPGASRPTTPSSSTWRTTACAACAKRLVSTGVLEVVATAIPGIREILVLGKVKQLERSGSSDLIVLDAPAAGHAVTFLTSALGLMDAARGGPLRAQAQDVVEMLRDPARCQVMLVSLPEETPVNELIETAYRFEDLVGVALAPVVVNACYPVLSRLSADPLAAAAAAGRKAAGPGGGRAAVGGREVPGDPPTSCRRPRRHVSPRACRSPSWPCPISSPPSSVPNSWRALAEALGAAIDDAGDRRRVRLSRRELEEDMSEPATARRRSARPDLGQVRHRLLRLGWHRQDDDLGGDRPRGAEQGAQDMRRHDRSGTAACRRPRAGQPRQQAAPDPGRLERRAVGGDAGRQEHLRRPDRPLLGVAPSKPSGSSRTASIAI